jgi:hypothetical protein
MSRSEDEREELLISPAADEFAKALDHCGWMIVPEPQPRFAGDRWRLNRPSAECPDGLTGVRLSR